MPQLEFVDFSAEVEVDLCLNDPPPYFFWLHAPVIPVDLHLRVFGARWAADDEIRLFSAQHASHFSAVLR